MFKLLKKKPEKVKQVIEFKLKFHATMVCMYVSIHVCMYARQFFFELLFFGGFFLVQIVHPRMSTWEVSVCQNSEPGLLALGMHL